MFDHIHNLLRRILILSFLLFVHSCGQKQAKADSYQQQMDIDQAKVNALKDEIDALYLKLDEYMADYGIAEGNLSRAEQFQLFRSKASREEEVSSAESTISDIQEEVFVLSDLIQTKTKTVNKLCSKYGWKGYEVQSKDGSEDGELVAD